MSRSKEPRLEGDESIEFTDLLERWTRAVSLEGNNDNRPNDPIVPTHAVITATA